MKPICPITKEFCFEAEYGRPEACVENATLKSAISVTYKPGSENMYFMMLLNVL